VCVGLVAVLVPPLVNPKCVWEVAVGEFPLSAVPVRLTRPNRSRLQM
jgi:hypothetical protein